jgi:predicted PurR-regulated permease PerM
MGGDLREFGEGRVVIILACIVVVIAGMREAASIIVPFLLSIFIAIMCSGMFSWMRRKRVPAFLAISFIIVMIFGAIFGLGAYIGASVNDFIQQLPLYEKRLHDLIIMLIKWLRGFHIYISEKMILRYLNPGSAMEIIANLLSGLGSALTYAFLIFFTVVFILIEAPSFSKKVAGGGASGTGLDTIERIVESIEKYLALKTWISLATGVVVTVWLTILGVNYAVLWGVVAFLFNYIPNIGPFIAAIPPILLALVDAGLGSATLVTIGYVVIKTVMGDILEPVFMGRGLSLSMLVVFLSLVFWGWVLGPVGMLLSVPLTMIIKITCESFPSTRWIAVLLDAEAPEPVGGMAETEGTEGTG